MRKLGHLLATGLVIVLACGDDDDNEETTQGSGATSSAPSVSASTSNSASTGAGGSASNIEILDPSMDHYGMSYQEWAAAWWQWVYALPATGHPLFDPTGASCQAGQSGEVFFLAGNLTPEAVTRQCTIGADKALFFPVVNVTADNAGLDPADYQTDMQWQQQVVAFIDGIDDMSVTIDGELHGKAELFPAYRVGIYQSTYEVPENDSVYDFFGYPVNVVGTVDPTFGDGVYLMLAPLPAGAHEIVIYAFDGGASSGPEDDFTVDVTYELTIR